MASARLPPDPLRPRRGFRPKMGFQQAPRRDVTPGWPREWARLSFRANRGAAQMAESANYDWRERAECVKSRRSEFAGLLQSRLSSGATRKPNEA